MIYIIYAYIVFFKIICYLREMYDSNFPTLHKEKYCTQITTFLFQVFLYKGSYIRKSIISSLQTLNLFKLYSEFTNKFDSSVKIIKLKQIWFAYFIKSINFQIW